MDHQVSTNSDPHSVYAVDSPFPEDRVTTCPDTVSTWSSDGSRSHPFSTSSVITDPSKASSIDAKPSALAASIPEPMSSCVEDTAPRAAPMRATPHTARTTLDRVNSIMRPP